MKRAMSRRTVLRGLGACVGLPLLEAMVPVARATPVSPVRLVVFFIPNGTYLPRWTPADAGPGYTLSPILQPLASVRDEVTVLTGLANAPARELGAEEHGNCTGTILTCTHPHAAVPLIPTNGLSFEQHLAERYSSETAFASLELGSEASGICTVPWCAGLQNISWNGPGSPRTKDTDPASVFDRLFGGPPGGTSIQERERTRRYRASILDVVAADARDLSRSLGAGDRARLDEYLTALREVERRIVDEPPPSCQDLAWTPGTADVQQHVAQMRDLMLLALRCDRTRVITYMVGSGRSERPYGFLGHADSHHLLSHYGTSSASIDAVEDISRWEVSQYVALLEAMRDVAEPDGSLLDNSMVLLLSGMGDPNVHTPVDLPVLLAGRAGGAFAPGKHLVLPQDTPVANLYLAMLDAAGVHLETFGDDGTAPLSGLA